MLFNSLAFLVFFPVVTTLYFVLPHRFRWFMLLAASCAFYMFFVPVYILVLFTTILIDYFAAILIENNKERPGRVKYLLFSSVVSTCLVLFIFKYFNFVNANMAFMAQTLHLNYPIHALQIILPIGLSFHTFQSLSYVIEVYRGRQQAERHFGIYALYVMFYPQLVAGPIERPQNLLGQFREKHCFDYDRVTDGLKLMLWGMFKKVVIADRLAVAVTHVYGAPAGASGLTLMIATVFFAFQIYCDFSGYSDIAIGSAQVMGFRLMDNFNRPYFSQSVPEFWKRWHISLSSWFRDYVYIPLGGKRVGPIRWRLNLFITFLLSGFWHGANWTYVAWGALNGLYLIASVQTAGLCRHLAEATRLARLPRLRKAINIVFTFTLVCSGWVLFRAKDIADAARIFKRIFQDTPLLLSRTYWKAGLAGLGIDAFQVLLCFILILFVGVAHLIQRHGSIRHMLRDRPFWVRWPLYCLLIVGIFIFGMFGEAQFIYFQF